MELGIVGLGRMGGDIARRLKKGGHRVVAYNRTSAVTRSYVEEAGIVGAFSFQELAELLERPRTVWLMVPAGEVTQSIMDGLVEHLSRGDTIIDGGNSNYKDTLRRSETLKNKGISLVDVGTSGGIWGLEGGFSLMVGGDREVVDRLSPLFQTLAPGVEKGWGRVGPTGSGHFVKMVHNGIEYGLMQAYAEGFSILRAKKEFDLDLRQIAEIWRHGSVVRSWLLDLVSNALSEASDLANIKGWVADSGEGRWTVAEAIELGVAAPVISLALQARFTSRDEEKYSARLLAAVRREFGGHAVERISRESEG